MPTIFKLLVLSKQQSKNNVIQSTVSDIKQRKAASPHIREAGNSELFAF